LPSIWSGFVAFIGLCVGEVLFVIPSADCGAFGDYVSIVIGCCFGYVPEGHVIDAARGRKVGCGNAGEVDGIAAQGEGPEALDCCAASSDGIHRACPRMAGIKDVIGMIQANLSET